MTGKVTNCATVTDTVSGDDNDTSCDDTDIDTKSDLAITKTAPATGIAGNNVTYTLDVTNLGPSDATDVVVDDALPTGLSYVSASRDGLDLFRVSDGHGALHAGCARGRCGAVDHGRRPRGAGSDRHGHELRDGEGHRRG